MMKLTQKRVNQRRDIPESRVAWVWGHQALGRGGLFTDRGERVEVVYPGREDGDSGPDFKGAILDLGGALVRGDVELHLYASDWWAHGHHRDPVYNRVVLHVVLWRDEERPTTLEGGNTVPTLALGPCLEGLSLERETLPPKPCRGLGERLGGEIDHLLEGAGEERFLAKAAHFRRALSAGSPSQVLYEGLMGALGYTKNKEAFEEVARRLPLALLGGYVQRELPQRQTLVLEALLLGVAGLVGRFGGGERERLWRSFEGLEAMRVEGWHLFRVRPENHPARRLLGAARLLLRYGGKGLLGGLLQVVEKPQTGHRDLEEALAVYEGERALIGRGRAGEMAVNVVLPFFLAWSEVASRPNLRGQVLELYRSYPCPGENRITREMIGYLWGRGHRVGSARRQQGLLHLHKVFCLEGRCGLCPLGTISA